MESDLISWKIIIENCPEMIVKMPLKLKTREFIEPFLQNGTVNLDVESVGEELANDSDLKFKYGPYDSELADRLFKNDRPRFIKYLKSTTGRLNAMHGSGRQFDDDDLTENDMKDLILLGNSPRRDDARMSALTKRQQALWTKVYLEIVGDVIIMQFIKNHDTPKSDRHIFYYVSRAIRSVLWGDNRELSADVIMRAIVKVKTYFAPAGPAAK